MSVRWRRTKSEQAFKAATFFVNTAPPGIASALLISFLSLCNDMLAFSLLATSTCVLSGLDQN